MGADARGADAGGGRPDSDTGEDLEVLEAEQAHRAQRGAPCGQGAPPGRPWSGTWAQRRAGVVVAVLVAALLGAGAGAVVAARHAGAVDRDARAALSVQAGLPSLVQGVDPGTAHARGLAPVTLAVPVSNRGPSAVDVSVLGVQAADQRLAGNPPRVRVPAGATASMLVTLTVDCVRHLAVSSSDPAPSPGALRVRLGLPAGERDVGLPLAEQPTLTVSSLLDDACTPAPLRRSTQVVRWQPRPDGRLVVSVSNALSTASVHVDLRQTPGLGVVSDPPLPLRVPPVGVREVTLTLAPDCAVVGSTVSGSSAGTFDLVTVADGVVQARLADDERSSRAAWLARRLALLCG